MEVAAGTVAAGAVAAGTCSCLACALPDEVTVVMWQLCGASVLQRLAVSGALCATQSQRLADLTIPALVSWRAVGAAAAPLAAWRWRVASRGGPTYADVRQCLRGMSDPWAPPAASAERVRLLAAIKELTRGDGLRDRDASATLTRACRNHDLPLAKALHSPGALIAPYWSKAFVNAVNSGDLATVCWVWSERPHVPRVLPKQYMGIIAAAARYSAVAEWLCTLQHMSSVAMHSQLDRLSPYARRNVLETLLSRITAFDGNVEHAAHLVSLFASVGNRMFRQCVMEFVCRCDRPELVEALLSITLSGRPINRLDMPAGSIAAYCIRSIKFGRLDRLVSTGFTQVELLDHQTLGSVFYVMGADDISLLCDHLPQGETWKNVIWSTLRALTSPTLCSMPVPPLLKWFISRFAWHIRKLPPPLCWVATIDIGTVDDMGMLAVACARAEASSYNGIDRKFIAMCTNNTASAKQFAHDHNINAATRNEAWRWDALKYLCSRAAPDTMQWFGEHFAINIAELSINRYLKLRGLASANLLKWLESARKASPDFDGRAHGFARPIAEPRSARPF